jgi:hypothetical protein
MDQEREDYDDPDFPPPFLSVGEIVMYSLLLVTMAIVFGIRALSLNF